MWGCILALVIWHKKLYLVCAISYCHLLLVLLYHIFPHYLKNGIIFGKEYIEHKIFILISSTNFVWKISPNTFSLCSSLNVRDQISVIQNNRQNYSTVILTFIFLDSKKEDKIFWTKWQQAFPSSICSFSSRTQFWLLIVVPRYLNLVTNGHFRISFFLKSSTTPSNHWSHGIPTLLFLWACNPNSSGCLIILHSL